MKKTLLFLGALALSLGANAQTEKELTTNSSLDMGQTSIACSNNETGETLDNQFYKKFNLTDLGVQENEFHVTNFGFAISNFLTVGDPSLPVLVELYRTSVNTFPATWGSADYTFAGDATKNIREEHAGEFVYANFDDPVTFAKSEVVIAKLSYGAGNMQALHIGQNEAPDTEDTYLTSDDCSLPNPATMGSLGFPGVTAIMTLKGTDGFLGVEDVVFEGFKHFTSNNTLHISNDTAIQTVEIYNVLGQKVIVNNANASNVSVDLASLTNGVYITKVTVDGIEKTFKIIK